MDILRIIFIILFLFSMGCAIKGITEKRRNVAFVILALMIAASDLFSFAIVEAHMVKNASDILLPYYILHAWSLLAFLVMVILIDHRRNYIVAVVMAVFVCIYQTYLVISQYLGGRVFSFQRRIYFRKAFWVAVDSKNTGLLFSYRSYRIGLYINIAIILCVLVIRIIRANKIFRTRFYALMLIAIVYSAVESIRIHFVLPMWIPSIAYNMVTILGLYFTSTFARSRLREWSLDSFANDMSDGLVLYDRYNDLIHINAMIKNTLDEKLVEDFRDKEKLESWIEESKDEDEGSIVISDDNKSIIAYKYDDKIYYFKVKVIVLGDDDAKIGTLFILHDTTDSLTQIKLMEKANEELERASRMKSDFLANMSHEIRTPMNAVIGMAEIAMREKNPQQITDYLLQIQSSGKNLLNIINDILDYSKIESGKMEIIEDGYEPFTEYSEIANVVATRIGNKPLDLIFFIETELPHKLLGDAMRIRQVLINLANNAVKFTKEGFVRVIVTCEYVSEDTVNLTFHVTDTGIGIKEEDLEKLFVSFQQVDSKRNRSVEGTGLGLAIAKNLVEAMGGTIGVDSEYGKGSDFWFTVPQKVIDKTNDILVENAANKRAFIIETDGRMFEIFKDAMDKLDIDSVGVASFADYMPADKNDYFFFKEGEFNDEAEEFLRSHENVSGIMMVDIASDFSTDISNLHILHKPATTMDIVRMLNDRYEEGRKLDDDKLFRADFIAPEAKILVVDDNQINLTIASELMAPLKVKLDTADGGQKAIDKVTANEYDIVFMDHMMPEIDGVDATKTIRAAGSGSHQPVIIALSANVMEEAKRLFEEAGMNDFVAKPIDVRKLVAAIRKWLPPEKIVESDGTEFEASQENADEIILKCEELDVDTAVHGLGSASLFNKIAEEYYRSGEERLNSIMNAFDNKDWTDYTIKVHALKSSSRQIGAMELGNMAEALEKAGKADDIDTILADNDKAMSAFRALLDKMAAFYPDVEEDEGDKPPIDNEALKAFMDELEEYCDNLDLDGMEEISAKLKGYSFTDELSALIDSLNKAVSDIDTDECMSIIDQIRVLADE